MRGIRRVLKLSAYPNRTIIAMFLEGFIIVCCLFIAMFCWKLKDLDREDDE
jgi:hypothetical protein